MPRGLRSPMRVPVTCAMFNSAKTGDSPLMIRAGGGVSRVMELITDAGTSSCVVSDRVKSQMSDSDVTFRFKQPKCSSILASGISTSTICHLDSLNLESPTFSLTRTVVCCPQAAGCDGRTVAGLISGVRDGRACFT
jgi:hypothetical protein